MTGSVRIVAPASDEFAAAVQSYEQQRRGLGAEFYVAITETTNLIESNPEAGSPIPDDELIRRMLVPRFPHQVVYLLRPDEIVIAAIAHLKRRPGYWRYRT